MPQGGIYLPMPDHVAMFCMTSNFLQCPQYVQGRELLKVKTPEYACVTEGSRRRFRRVSEHLRMTLAMCGDSGEQLDIIDDAAVTVDLSAGGVRIESMRSLPKQGRVTFKFAEGSGLPSWMGIGEIRWTKVASESRFQSGVAFVDSRTKQAIGAYIGLPGLPLM